MVELIPLVATSERWVARACSDVESLLLDHAHCEKKAAATALAFIFRMPDQHELINAMSKLAREELLHFERLLMVLREHQMTFRRLPPSAYAKNLIDYIRKPRSFAKNLYPQIVDELLVAALIEARSTERFRKLQLADLSKDLRELFAELAEVEARHKNVYYEQALTFERAERVAKRAAELAEYEATILETPEQELRLHSG
ncbi:MAG: tRNA isopentenyl-2-thiomethyl-A-37 hydroxylase MiaE [Planctomycetota bacterium]